MFKSRGAKAMTSLHQLSTSHGSIAVEEVGRGDRPIILNHGNSLSREVALCGLHTNQCYATDSGDRFAHQSFIDVTVSEQN
jgi:hypothetical protein